MRHFNWVATLVAFTIALSMGSARMSFAAQGQEQPNSGIQSQQDPTVQPSPNYPSQNQPAPDQTDSRTDPNTYDNRATTAWTMTIMGFLLGVGVGWIIFKAPSQSRTDDKDIPKAA